MIRLGNYSQIKQQLKDFEDKFSKEQMAEVARESRTEIAKAGLAWIREYPPETDANQPGGYPKRWYERGFGQRWALAGGGVGGRETSEKLGDNWKTQDQGAVGMAGTSGTSLNNPVTYYKWVHTDATQARFHRERGWRTDRLLFNWIHETGLAVEKMRAAVKRVLGKD